MFLGFIKGELIRYVKRCTLFDDFVRMAALFSARLRVRGYPAGIMRRGYKLVSFAQRSRYLTPATGGATPDTLQGHRRIALVMDYSKQVILSGVHTIYRDHLSWLPKHFDSVDFVNGWRAASKLGRSLVTYRFPRPAASIQDPRGSRSNFPIISANQSDELFSNRPAVCSRECTEAFIAALGTPPKQTVTTLHD